MSVQATIEAALGSLSPSLGRVGSAIRENPAMVLDSTINDLATACDTSVASVVRFCRAIGLSGYTQLRMLLAAELGKEAAQFGGASYGADITEGESLPAMAQKIAALEILAIEETIERMDYRALEEIVDALDGADRILLYGVGASRSVAEDLQGKLFRIGRNAFAPSEPHEAWAAAAIPVEGVVVIGFSHLGETHETVEFLRLARDHGARTIGITGVKDSSLARLADIAVFTQVRETTFRAGAMVSRIAQLAVVDCIFAGVAQRRYDYTIEALRRTREVTRGARGV
ncbi:MurR/RpiR family transcriptional regulator [Georgenia thermotolerans]|uniref:SIS domain-containing protein n=1 Tax=Georgenia thermotolerans TaxID=527326 RepID=A0A7J5URS7_9MICO|nr:MurR/RpiR family transcriptional regulator [Georgenia thermotolerans]KAE8765078.1 SIS domain-containing protein [Georgenia thermotolerans]